jgi:hypothetical protein
MQQTAMEFDDRIKYPDGFWKWLADPNNKKLYDQFSKRASQMALRRERYSARTIIEVMRWNTDLSDSNETFKIGNNMVPGMARLWLHEHGQRHPKFFQLRDSLGYDSRM